ncbi:hypothetical protein D9M72_635730 [compost metagenome]
MPDDSLLELAVSDAVIDNDLRLEAVGIEPDISVTSPLAYAAGRDPQREAAVNEMARMLAAGKNGKTSAPLDPALTR